MTQPATPRLSHLGANTRIVYASLATTVRQEAPLETVIDDLKPTVPAALADGRIPVSALEPHLVVHAPLVDVPGYISEPGDVFEASLNGLDLAETQVTFAGGDEKVVELRIPKARLDALDDGAHSLSYSVTIKPWGHIVRSGRTRIALDRKPAGGRYMPRIVFDETLELDGLSLSTLLALPDATLSGTIPDYAEIDPLDTIHVFYKLRGSDIELSAGTVAASTDGRPMVVRLDRDALEKIDGPGRVDFYYYVEDAVGVESPASTPAALNLSIKGSPLVLPPPVILGSDDELVTDRDARPLLAVHIPQTTPHALPGDTVQLFIGTKAFPAVEIEAADLDDGPMKAIYLDYGIVRAIAEESDTVPFEKRLRYIHRRKDVASYSDEKAYAFDLTLPGGWDPMPETIENEALSAPILRGATGAVDNVISLPDSSLPAKVYIDAPLGGLRGMGGIERGDVIVVTLAGDAVSAPVIYDGEAYPLTIEIPATALEAHSGFTFLGYEINRKLTTTPHYAVALSPTQPVRIDSAGGLPGAGAPLAKAIFTKAREREEATDIYGLFVTDFSGGITPLRIFGYANMRAGDTVKVVYEGFDQYEGGNPVDGAKGELSHRVSASDVVPKAVQDPVTGDYVYIDIDFPIDIAKQVAHGHIAYHHQIVNDVGEASSPTGDVLIRVRF